MAKTYSRQIKNAFRSLENYIARGRVSSIESKRALLDLYTIEERLKKGEYRKANFSSNKFDIEDRNQQAFTDLEFYCLVGKTWSYLLDAINVRRAKEVADICPGYSPKIELALYYSGFRNKVVLLERSSKNALQLIRFMELIQPPFIMQQKKVDILRKSKSNYDIVLGNHIIDDIVINHFAKKFDFNTVDLYLKETSLKKFWDTLLKQKASHADIIVELVAPRLASLVRANGYLAISHYAGYGDRLLGLQSAVQFNMDILQKISLTLCEDFGFIDRHRLAKKALFRKQKHFGASECILLQRAQMSRSLSVS